MRIKLLFKNKKKWKKDKYPPMVRKSQKVGTWCNFTFFPLILPFCVTLAPQPWWMVLLDGSGKPLGS